MPTTETLRPTVATEIDPTLVTGSNAYDGDTGTYAGVQELTEGGGGARAEFDGFPAGSIPVTKRQSVVLGVYLDWGSADTNDKAGVWIRPKGTDPFVLISNAKPPSTYVGTYLYFDITDIVGTEPISSLDVRVVFSNLGTGSDDTPPGWEG